MDNDRNEELIRRRRAAWSAYGSLKEATDLLYDADLGVHLFDSTVRPALCYAAETWPDTSATAKSLQVTHRALERCLLKFTRLSQHRAGLRSSDLRQMSRLRPCGLHIESETSMGRSHNEKRRRPLDKKNGGMAAARLHAASWKTTCQMV
ncbi:hypothetical protein Q1695_007741 [Nippostrongylus brasiliensis]|nr:hypothetical protein Q1695_007741 [Nippostrongylus brasiliensis]